MIINTYQPNASFPIELKEILYGDEKIKPDMLGDPLIEFDKFKNFSNIPKNQYEITKKNYTKFLLFLKDIEENIKKAKMKFKYQIILEIKREKFGEENTGGLYNLSCITTFHNQKKSLDNEENKMQFLDKNILVNSINGNPEGLLYLINELTNDDYREQFEYKEEQSEVLEDGVDSKKNG